ncbi:hypothetical protein [Photorhabdus laumondii]|uniref:hypothetical protein n=1 Tax=Photorhabdus laumondii TaxID=2218628 RepID=UPI003315933A
MTGVSECSQQRGNLKDNGYRLTQCFRTHRKVNRSTQHIIFFLGILCRKSTLGFI